jgi:hypothetical protein
MGPRAVEPFKAFLSQDMAFQEMAERLAEDDFALANSHTLVSFWSGIECCVEDTVVLALMNDRQTVNAVRQELKLSSNLADLLDEPQARRAFRDLERKARQGRGVMEAYDWCLGLLDVQRIPGSDLASPFAEVNALRNAIMHNSGLADQRTVDAAPRLGLRAGAEIRVSRDQLRFYYDCLGTFVQELLAGVTKSRHMRSKEELEENDV